MNEKQQRDTTAGHRRQPPIRFLTGIAAIAALIGLSACIAPPSWRYTATPQSPGGNVTELFETACRSSTMCLAVGSYRTTTAVTRPLVERWNGISWTKLAVPAPAGSGEAFLRSVSCTSTTFCVAVGRWRDTSNGDHTLTERWNGTAWSIMATPNTGGPTGLNQVSCTSATMCMAVGSQTKGIGDGLVKTLTERWDGSSWSIIASPNPATSLQTQFAGVACVSASSCFATGEWATNTTPAQGKTLAERWDGSTWSLMTTPNKAGQDTALAGITCTAATNCVAAGYSLADAIYHPLAGRWNGTAWSLESLPSPANPHGTLVATPSCASAGDCWMTATSGNLVFGQKEKLSFVHWNGSTWSSVAGPTQTSTVAYVGGGTACTALSSCLAVGTRRDLAGSTPMALVYR